MRSVQTGGRILCETIPMITRLVLLLGCALGCSGSTFVLCSTGFSTASGSGCGSAINSPAANNLLPDGNWYVASNSSGTFQSQAFVTVNNALPLQAPGPWLADDANSAWLTATNNQNASVANGTQSFFSTNFTLTAGQVANAVIAGSWLADDYGTGIFLNGVAVAQSQLPAFGSLGGPMTAFSIKQGTLPGDAMFVTGQNTITFGFMNDATNHGAINSPNPGVTGARVLITQADSVPPAVPEPATFGLLAVALGAMVFVHRSRK